MDAVIERDKLSTADIADLLRVSRQHVTDRLTKQPDFPKPIINISRRTRFWRRQDIERWAMGPKR